MKKFGFMLLLLLFVLVWPREGHAAAGNNKIILDGTDVTAGQSVPVENVKGTIMVPLRMISENLGYKVDWNQASQTVTITQQSQELKLVVGQKTASVDGKSLELSQVPYMKNYTTLVPIRFISEQFGVSVNWDNTQKIVSLITPNSAPVTGPSGSTGGTSGGDASGAAGGGTATSPSAGTAAGLSQINGISFSDNMFMIAMSGDAKPVTSTMTGKIIIDIPNATFSDSFITGQQLKPELVGTLAVDGYPDVKQVRYSLYSSNPYTVRFVIDLTGSSKSFAVETTGDSASRLAVVNLNASVPSAGDSGGGVLPGSDGRKVIVLDAGHGAKDSGAVGITGKYEKNFNLAVVLKAAELLRKEANIDVVTTRSNDTFLELKERVAIAENLNADLFISVHANSSSSSAASGTETYYKRSGASKDFAGVMHKYLVEATGLKDRGVQYGNFHVIRETTMPAILLEVGYLSNKNDEALLFTEDLQNRVAAAIVKGVKEYLGMK
ncbi:N-acetylmuramoyl-L-alanine amidase [Paenibacillus spiritus]|uniref:N-acetylmuramoyl-L-alanine amidase n=1 Tax=Paenibacillus spiritus TaxID=2496557 RepID=A0A5J5GE94_9BACL|nr:N-acetylmuramoyl-L-alanine amidase [Paenibacillus spiritus]KAA9006290.1 N-acetylmuramoyl-L-alanine amidase [Paenibacillus spiritus]